VETVTLERPNAVVTATCSSVRIAYRNFPNATGNTVTEKVTVNTKLGTTFTQTDVFTFNGPSGTDEIPVTTPLGRSTVDAQVKWNTNGFKGGFDVGPTLTCRTYMTGRAFGLSAETPLIDVPPTPDTGPVATPIASSTTTPCVLAIPGAIAVEVLCANVTTHLAPAQSTATATVANLSILGLVPLTPIAATAIEAGSTTTCAATSGRTKFASLTIGLTNYVNYEPQPNTTIELPLELGKIVLNEQVPVPGAYRGLTVNAIHLTVPSLGINVIVSSASSDIERC
jgi:hypothetical protein